MNADLLWPAAQSPQDLPAIEQVPLESRGLPTSTYGVVLRAAQLWPDRTAITVLAEGADYQRGARRTFGQLADDVTRTAKALRRCGINRDNAVLLISPNCDELITATLAAQAAGIAVPINGSLSDQHVLELARLSGARLLITAAPDLDPRGIERAAILADAGLLDTVLLVRPTLAHDVPEPLPALSGIRVGYLSTLAAEQDPQPLEDGTPDTAQLAALFHTGGTTGMPKLAAHTHGNEVADAWMVALSADLADDAAVFAALPLFHVNALLVTLLAPLLRGRSVVWAGPLGYRDMGLYQHFWKIVEHYRLAAMSAVPTVYAVLAQIPVDADITTLTSAVSGASALPDTVRQDFLSATGVNLVEGYGLTEATCASARSFADHPRPGSVGQRMPYQQLRVVEIGDDGSWHDVLPRQVGTLAISGPTVFPGYVTGRAEHGYVLDGRGALRDGWLDTGDLASVDEEGFIYLAGRAKDLIIRGGHNIDPALIEDVLLAHPDVTAAAAVARPDAHSGEVPVGFVTVRPGATVTGDELAAFAVGHITERAAAPKCVTIIDAIPVTDVGKPYKVPLRAIAAEHAVAEALSGHAGVLSVHGTIDAGVPVVMIDLAATADRAAVERTVKAFAVNHEITEP
ncbi:MULTISPECIES: acyl-CoA synthetase [Mycobacteriaceae]|uniref:AMP-binding protein n=1 Tax=Mycolicibacterium neoaurum VKM Ac-1815D TaxID=700508 RepID=V5X780_MYCNE|nr:MULTISPECIES: acyl-CoA synthetase [Mycobacteriaceae]AHC23526.1 AMP-binding protein [Mycolicibacterium neoaurum VKM Ac-1815D]AMO04225.1 AMP-binding protein [Mycolicibacterium neoaurum]KJQ48670.1 AMP-binding protein [Mycolicibacterium neoaurum]KUM08711.1 acyl-CoA synthetase [Mycolicibacterium neoaurum]